MVIPAARNCAKIVVLALICCRATAEESEHKGFDLSALLEAVGVNHERAVVVGGAGSGGAGIYTILMKKQGQMADTLADLRTYKKLGFNEVQLQSLKAGDVVLFSAQDLAEFHRIDQLARPGVVQPLYFRFTDEAGRTSQMTANMNLVPLRIMTGNSPVMEMRADTASPTRISRIADAENVPLNKGAERVGGTAPDAATAHTADGTKPGLVEAAPAEAAGRVAPAPGDALLTEAKQADIAAEENALSVASGNTGSLGVPYQVGSAEARLGEESGLVRALSIGEKYVRVARVAVVIAAVAVAYACYEYFEGGPKAPAVTPKPRATPPAPSPMFALSQSDALARALRGDTLFGHGRADEALRHSLVGGGFYVDRIGGSRAVAPALPPVPEIRHRYLVGYVLSPQGQLTNFKF